MNESIEVTPLQLLLSSGGGGVGAGGGQHLRPSLSNAVGQYGGNQDQSDDEADDEADDEHELDSCNSSLKDSLHDSETSFSMYKGGMLVGTLRYLIIALLALVTLVAPAGVYYLANQAIRHEFESDFGSLAETIVQGCDWNLARKLIALEDLATDLTNFGVLSSSSTSTTPDINSWPYVSLPNFDEKAIRASEMADTTSILFAPHVTSTTRSEWETYSLTHANWITQSETNVDDNSSTRVSGEIFGPNRGTVIGTGPYFPIWQHNPIRSNLVNMDFLSLAAFHDALSIMLDTRQAVIGKTSVAAIDMAGLSEENNSFEPVSNVFYPVFDTLEGDRESQTVVGTLATSISWKSFLSNILPTATTTGSMKAGLDLICVLENDCGLALTYQVNGEGIVEMIGEGDLHNPAYEDLEEYYSFHSVADSSFLTPRQSRVHLSEKSCIYSVHVFPSHQARQQYESMMPIAYAALVGGLFLVLFLVTIAYTNLLQKRIEIVQNKAEESRAVVSNLFPSRVRERLFRRNMEQREKRRSHSTQSVAPNTKSSRSSSRGGRIPLPLLPQRSLKQFLRDEHSLSGRKQQRSIDDDLIFADEDDFENPMTKPIADKFESTSILFADIAGFTKWSSEREPEKVFILLQTLFGEFDKIARKRGVFKVETIGDCYVAATGLPDIQSDHALRMTKFARECLFKVPGLLDKLQSTLGPDTLALDMRFGIHSGPVTAGILAGEKSRFQIFGDTVNTAARMESLGKRGKIHVSDATAELIIGAGKGRWLKAREDVVEAKGKGLMHTHWVVGVGEHQKKKARRSSMSTESETGRSSVSGSIDHFNSSVSCMSDTDRMSESGNSFGLDHSTGSDTDWTTPREASFGSSSEVSQKLPSLTERGPPSEADPSEKHTRPIGLIYEVLSFYLKQIEACRSTKSSSSLENLDNVIVRKNNVLDEVSDFIPLKTSGSNLGSISSSKLPSRLPGKVEAQLKDYITTIAACHRDNNTYHNFARTAHITVSAHKMLTRIRKSEPMCTRGLGTDCADELRVDPLLQFAVVFSTLIHDVDHAGIPNDALCKENPELAAMCVGCSVAEQNSVEIGWELLMDSCYGDLQQYIFGTKAEVLRFRQLVVNMVMATDIFNVTMRETRSKRWHKAYDTTDSPRNADKSLRIAVVIEHFIQAVDVAHTMQGWKVYKKWNNSFFNEQYEAYLTGRITEDPSVDWYNTELLLFDDYVIPLVIRLRESRIFGTEGDDFVQYAVENRRAWSRQGREIVKEMVCRHQLKNLVVEGATSILQGERQKENEMSSSSFSLGEDSSRYRFKLDEADPNPQRRRSSQKKR